MLVLSRKKLNEVLIRGDIRVQVSEIRGNKVRFAIFAPGNVKVLRGELDETPEDFVPRDRGPNSKPLMLTRRIRETIVIDDVIVIEVIRISGNTARLGIEAPLEIKILRGELEFYESSNQVDLEIPDEQDEDFESDFEFEEIPEYDEDFEDFED